MLDVLFVCTGNICRSPLAEAFLQDRSRRLLDGRVRVRSAGTWGRPGHPAMPETIEVAGERDLDLRGHRATPLGAALIEEADLILGMTEEHRDEIVRMLPRAAPRVFTLKELASLLAALERPPGPLSEEAVRARIAEADRLRRDGASRSGDTDVADPLGFGAETYRAIAWEIEEAVAALMGGLFGVVERPAARKDA